MLLQLRNITKAFGGVTALRGASLSAQRGEVHLLLGENGAGKSTLMKIAAGMIAPDSGEIVWQGRTVRFGRPSEAAAHGVAMVHQESLLAPQLSVAENVFLGREPGPGFGIVNRSRMLEATARLIETHGFPLQPEWRVERLPPSGRQLVEICRAIQHGSSLLIFDEPTSALSDRETGEVIRIVRELCERNMAVVYITHRFEELRSLGDRVTILRDGETVHTGALADMPQEAIIRLMVGREIAASGAREPGPRGRELLRTEGLTRASALRDVSISLHAGEITGLAGLVGAGRTELCRALFGIDRIDSGRVFVDGREVRLRSPREAVSAGIALIPEDRQRHGVWARLPVSLNLTCANLAGVGRLGFVNGSAERRASLELIERFRIRTESPAQLAGRLSGGNQQKVAIARWLFGQARVFLFDEPARGIDVGAKAEVFGVMDELARNGAAILMVSSELPELIRMADRILVMRQGRISGELTQPASQEQIMRLATLEEAE